MAENKYGRPPKYSSADEIQAKIDEYFKACEGEPLKDSNGNQVLNKYGLPVFVHVKPPTITGLALALGFTSRQALLNYQAKKDFVDTITRAKARVEEYTETRLFDRDGAMGAKFSLANNFKGWSEKPGDGDTPPPVNNLLDAIHKSTEAINAVSTVQPETASGNVVVESSTDKAV